MAPQILVIDDLTSLSRFIVMELSAAGYQARIYCNDSLYDSDTEKSLALQAFNPDLILLNWELRSASGLDICRQLRGSDSWVPIVVVTVQESSCSVALKLGAQACLIKPFSMNNLLNKIGQQLQPDEQRGKCLVKKAQLHRKD